MRELFCVDTSHMQKPKTGSYWTKITIFLYLFTKPTLLTLLSFFADMVTYHYYSHLLTHKIHATCLNIILLGATQVRQKKIAMSDHQPKKLQLFCCCNHCEKKLASISNILLAIIYHCSRFLKFFTTTVNLCWHQPMN